ncbi:MAG: hypothetical protein LUC88_06165 [Prevotella sp.]|nr:hypothetical protein [Prevotella sp.]
MIRGFYQYDKEGDIDLIWNNPDGGLWHIIEKHVGYTADGRPKDIATVEELADEIEFILGNGGVSPDVGGKLVVSVGDDISVVCTDYLKKKKNWVLTTYETSRTPEEKGNATHPTVDPQGAERRPGSAAPRISDAKIKQNSESGKGNDGKSPTDNSERLRKKERKPAPASSTDPADIEQAARDVAGMLGVDIDVARSAEEITNLDCFDHYSYSHMA